MEYPLNVKFRYESEPLLWELDAVYSKDECERFIEIVESHHPGLATNNIQYRNQHRVIIDDPVMAANLFDRINYSFPQTIEEFSLSRLNERLRFYKYVEGQHFTPHMDHWYQASDTEISLFSVLVYFNEDFEGGETRFMEQLDAVVQPKTGKVAAFQHKIRHEGCVVTKGIKYAMRTDVMYRKG